MHQWLQGATDPPPHEPAKKTTPSLAVPQMEGSHQDGSQRIQASSANSDHRNLRFKVRQLFCLTQPYLFSTIPCHCLRLLNSHCTSQYDVTLSLAIVLRLDTSNKDHAVTMPLSPSGLLEMQTIIFPLLLSRFPLSSARLSRLTKRCEKMFPRIYPWISVYHLVHVLRLD